MAVCKRCGSNRRSSVELYECGWCDAMICSSCDEDHECGESEERQAEFPLDEE